MVGPYPLSSQAPTHVEVELGCDNSPNLNHIYSSTIQEYNWARQSACNKFLVGSTVLSCYHQHSCKLEYKQLTLCLLSVWIYSLANICKKGHQTKLAEIWDPYPEILEEKVYGLGSTYWHFMWWKIIVTLKILKPYADGATNLYIMLLRWEEC